MKGNNELRINHATMIEVVQLWVDSKFKEPLRVENVEQLSSTNYCREFSVKITDTPKDDPPTAEVK